MIERLLMKLRRFDTVSAEEERALRSCVLKQVRFGRATVIIEAKTELETSHLLLDGIVHRYKDLKSGARQSLQLGVAGDFLDLHSLLLKQLDHDVGSLTDCHMALFPHSRLRELLSDHQHLGRLLWLSTVVDAAIHREWMLSLGRRSALSRLANLFCELQVRRTTAGLAEHGSYELPLTQTDLSDVLGMTPVHINRMLKQLRDDGLATFKNKTVEVVDWERLVELAEFDPFYLGLNQRPR